MRIIGGEWRSRPILWPESSATRPMPDRVREAVFSMIGNHFDTPGALPPLRVADAFAGSGSMGLEALSRGATSCRFYETGREVLPTLRENLRRFDVDLSSVDTRNAWLAAASEDADFDLILLDPPYRQAQDVTEGGQVLRFLRRVESRYDHELTILLHHPKDVTWSLPDGGPCRVVMERTIGSNGITLFAL